MYDEALVKEKLEQVLEALLRVQRRFSGIKSPEDFIRDEQGRDVLDSIAMILIAVGENFKKMDKQTGGSFLNRYPDIDWQGVKGIRDVLAHDYFDIDADEIFTICRRDVPTLVKTVGKMLEDLG
jgi:uncharacterized protein with HEPN domain